MVWCAPFGDQSDKYRQGGNQENPCCESCSPFHCRLVFGFELGLLLGRHKHRSTVEERPRVLYFTPDAVYAPKINIF